MITVNGKQLEWHSRITFQELYTGIGYTLKNPRVITRVNGVNIGKNERSGYSIPDGAVIEIINTLCGG